MKHQKYILQFDTAIYSGPNDWFVQVEPGVSKALTIRELFDVMREVENRWGIGTVERFTITPAEQFNDSRS